MLGLQFLNFSDLTLTELGERELDCGVQTRLLAKVRLLVGVVLNVIIVSLQPFGDLKTIAIASL